MTRAQRLFQSGGKSFTVIVLLSIILIFLAAVMVFIIPRQKAAVFDTDPVVSYAHGTFIWENGISQPNTRYILDVQNHYIVKYEDVLHGDEVEPADRIENIIKNFVTEEVLANGLYIDWLIQQAGGGKFSTDSMTNHALRWYFISTIQDDPLPAGKNEFWTKGINADTIQSLESEGINIFEQICSAGDVACIANSDYINNCRSAGVPVPEKVFDGNDEKWDSFGILGAHITGDPRDEKELWMYLSSDPPGVCLALRVIKNYRDPPTGTFDLICMGLENNNACFFERLGNQNNLDRAVDITIFNGGEATNSVQCTRCHLGENAFIIHPQMPPFRDALLAKAAAIAAGNLIGNPSSWSGTDYYTPIEVPNWPRNPDPLDLSSVPMVEERDKPCSGCHNPSFAGRFPDVSSEPDPAIYENYCQVTLAVLTKNAPPLFPTMPMNDLENSDDYDIHKKYLLEMCDTPDEGVLVDNTFEDDLTFVSPPQIIVPVDQCAKAIFVDGFRDGAEVELSINDVVVGVVDPAELPDPLEFINIGQLEVGDIVRTRQKIDGFWSEYSHPVFVSSYQEYFPDGLPAPTIDPSTIYACSSVVAVRYDIAGFDLEVKVNGGDPVTGLTFKGHKPLTPGKAPFEFEDKFTAQVSACGDLSPISEIVLAERTSSTDLGVAEIDPTPLYETQNIINIGNLTYGSSSEVLESGSGSLGAFSTPLSWKHFRTENPLGLSDQLIVRQELCDFSSQPSFTQAPPLLSCFTLPAPIIKDPLPGDQFVRVIQPLLGATIRIYDESGKELGDGTGNVITLNRSLTDGEFIIAVQQVGDCISVQGREYEV